MKYNFESHKRWLVRILQDIVGTIAIEHEDNKEYIDAINYVIGYLIGMGWADDE